MMPDHAVQLAHTSFILISRNVQIKAKRSQEDALHGVDALHWYWSFAGQHPSPRDREVDVAQRRVVVDFLRDHDAAQEEALTVPRRHP